MERRTGFRRLWGPRSPSDAQRRVLDRLVEGKTNAVIAAELGISSETVKWHVGQLLSETGLDSREALALWWASERTSSDDRRPALIPALLSGRLVYFMPIALVFLVAIVFVFSTGGPDEEPSTQGAIDIGSLPEKAVLVADRRPPATCDPPEAQDLRIVTPEELRAEGLTPAGRLLVPVHCPLHVANRSDRALVWVGGDAIFDLEDVPPGWTYAGASDAGVAYEQGRGDPLLEAMAVGLRTPLRDAGVTAYPDEQAVVTLRTQGDGGYVMVLIQESGNFRKVALASNGELFIDERPMDGGVALDFNTGEAIDLTGLRPLTRLRAGIALGEPQARTRCQASICTVSYTSVPAGVLSPLAGDLTCSTTPREFDLDAGDLRLHFRTLDPNRPPAEYSCRSGAVAAGDPLPVSNIVQISAFDAGSSPVSIVTTVGGQVYVGDVTLRYSCPCGWEF